ncbi:hypothetical protein [Arthrobacter castelli]|uniref:hypothetical protein n=1 Tax=Arthrobacter castelli TaxID=271431 RepID=UPI000478C2CA|nr:hypothetical protein [Arthrobacter castelli]
MEPGFRVPISEALAGGRAGRGLLASIAGLDPSDFMFAVHQKNAGRPLLVELVNDAVGHWLATPRRQHDREFLALLGEFINSYAHGLESKWRGFDDVLIAALVPNS